MPREKIKRTDKVVVDMAKVKQLLTWRDMRNCQLEGTQYFCSLHPEESKRICIDCPRTIRKACFNWKPEREYIYGTAEIKGAPRRKRKQDNPKHWGMESTSKEDNDENIEYNVVEEDESSITETDKKYPCLEMNYACPAREKCNFGESCEYFSEDTASEEEKKYPCVQLSSVCSEKEHCDCGKKCPYKNS